MTHLHFDPETSGTPRGTQSDGARSGARRGARRGVLWLLLVISVACNMVISVAGINMFVGAAFGVVAVSSGAALITDHYRNRRP